MVLLLLQKVELSSVSSFPHQTKIESNCASEYLIGKYGKPVQLSETGKLDNLYCEPIAFNHPRCSLTPTSTVTHYAEGSLMPPLVLKLVFSLIPGQTPFFIRPLVRIIFNQVDAQYVDPQLKKHGAHVRIIYIICLLVFLSILFPRLRNISPS